MRNLIAAAIAASFTAACGAPDMCIVTRDGDDMVRKAEIVSADGTMTHYGTGFTEVGGSWQTTVHDANGQPLNSMIIVDEDSCDTVSDWSTTTARIAKLEDFAPRRN